MDLDRIHQIIDWFGKSDLTCFELTEGRNSLRLERPGHPTSDAGPSAPSAPESRLAEIATASQQTEPAETPVEAPLYGICYLSSAPGKPPFVEVGQSVKAGDTLCLVEAMKVLNAIHAPRDGIVATIIAPDGEEVEQGQTLMVLS